MASRRHQRVTYSINRALEACGRGDVAAIERYEAAIRSAAGDGALHRAYALWVSALRAPAGPECDRALEQACECFLDAGFTSGAAAVMLELSKRGGDSLAALAAAKRARDLFASAGDDIGRSKALSNLGARYMMMHDFAQAAEALRSAIEIQRRIGDRLGLGIAALNLSGCLYQLGRIAEALACARESVESLEAAGRATDEAGELVWQTNGWRRVRGPIERYLASAYVNYGNALSSLGENDEAIALLERAQELTRGAGDPSGEAMVLNQIGQMHLDLGRTAAAETCFRRSVELFERDGQRGYMYAVALQSLGEACAAQHRHSDAIDAYERAGREFAEHGGTHGAAETLLLVGELYAGMGVHDRAIASLEKSLALAQSISAAEIVVRCSRALGDATMRVDSSGAREHLLRALLLAEEHDMNREQVRIHRALAAYYKLVGDSSEALAHFEKYHALQQRILGEEAERRMQRLQVLHDVERYQRSLAEMAGRVEQVERELESKRRELATLAERIMEKQEFVKLVETGLQRLIAADAAAKDERAAELLAAIRRAGDTRGDWQALGEKFLSIHREFAERLMTLAPGLTQAELHVCVLARLSMGAKTIADVLGIEPKTVFNHQQSIRRKLGLENRENLKTRLMRLDLGAVHEQTAGLS